MKTSIAIIMGSQSDWKVMQEAASALDQFQIKYTVKVVSAHRDPVAMYEFAQSAHENFQIIIAGAGGAAHLPGMVAALTNLPVIGVPVSSKKLEGLDSLLSIAQMPKGVPVATMAVDGAFNAGLLAARILGSFDPRISKKISSYMRQNQKVVKQMNQSLKKDRKK